MTTARAMFKMEGPRWSGMETAIRELAMRHNIEVDIKRTTRFILLETLFVTMRGEYDDIQSFAKDLKYAIRNYNEDV